VNALSAIRARQRHSLLEGWLEKDSEGMTAPPEPGHCFLCGEPTSQNREDPCKPEWLLLLVCDACWELSGCRQP
jgi:hypothetical protein